MTNPRGDMAAAIQQAAKNLAGIRGESILDATKSVAQSMAENLRDSRGTSMEGYWRTMVEVADGQVGDALRDQGLV